MSESKERAMYLKAVKKDKRTIVFWRIFIVAAFFIFWEISTRTGLADPFIVSSPVRIVKTVISLYSQKNLFSHIMITAYETVMGFILGTVIGTASASLLWCFPKLCKVLEPYMVIFNSLPKIALGPVFIVWLGSGTGSIIVITLTVSVIVCIMDVLHGFLSTDSEMIKLIRTFGGSKAQVFWNVVLPSNINTIVNALKISVGMSWVGSIVGEFLVSKKGLGYLIVYGSQVFKLDLVMSSVLILSCVATLMYYGVMKLQQIIERGN